PAHLKVADLPMPGHPGHGQAAERGDRRVVGLQRGDGENIDARDGMADGVFPQEHRQRLDLGEFRHGSQYATRIPLSTPLWTAVDNSPRILWTTQCGTSQNASSCRIPWLNSSIARSRSGPASSIICAHRRVSWAKPGSA